MISLFLSVSLSLHLSPTLLSSLMTTEYSCSPHTDFLSSFICTPILPHGHPPSLNSTCYHSLSDFIPSYSIFSTLISLLSSLFVLFSVLSSLFSLSHIFFFLLFTPLLLFLPHSPSIIPCNTARVRFRNHQQPRGQNTH